MESIRIDVKAKVDTDFCKKGDIISMKKGVFEAYHKNNFDIVGEKKVVDQETKIPKKENKAIKNAKNK